MSRSPLFESLESRQLFSAAPIFDAAVAADRLMVKADLLMFQSHIDSNDAKLLIDAVKVKRNLVKGDTSLVAPFAQLHKDAQAMQTALKEDRLAEAANALADESTIKLARLQILKDKGTSAETADHAALMADRVKLQNDLIAGLDSRIATRQADEGTIAVDTLAIVNAADNDSQATTGLKLAAATFAANRVACINTLTTDLGHIASARTALIAALNAEQSAV